MKKDPLFVDSSEIVRPHRVATTPVIGIRKIHSIRPLAPGIVHTMCHTCILTNQPTSDITDEPWRVVMVQEQPMLTVEPLRYLT